MLHLLEKAVLNEQGAVEVAVTTLQRAIELVDAMDDWALGFHEQAAAGDEQGGVSSLMRRIHTLARKARRAGRSAGTRKKSRLPSFSGVSRPRPASFCRSLRAVWLLTP